MAVHVVGGAEVSGVATLDTEVELGAVVRVRNVAVCRALELRWLRYVGCALWGGRGAAHTATAVRPRRILRRAAVIAGIQEVSVGESDAKRRGRAVETGVIAVFIALTGVRRAAVPNGRVCRKPKCKAP